LIKITTDDEVMVKRIEIMEASKKAGKWQVEVKRCKHLVLKRIVE